MASIPPQKIDEQIKRAGLPTGGAIPFVPKLTKNRSGDAIIEKQAVKHGPKRNKRGYVDSQDRIWIKDRAHGSYPDHWDVQEDGGKRYFKVDEHGNLL